MAIVAEPRWETLALAFAEAGVHRAPVKFFPASQLEQAHSWVAKQVATARPNQTDVKFNL